MKETIHEMMRLAAMTYIESGWKPLPLCNPTLDGRCGCGGRHSSREVGKAPVTGRGWQHIEVSEKQAQVWWGQLHVGANVGLLLAPSNLMVVDLDGPEAVAEALRLGLPDTLRAKTRKGWHYYYKRPAECAVRRATQRGESEGIDVLTNGYVVAAPSRHATGAIYEWDGAFCPVLPEPPEWAVDIIRVSANPARDQYPDWMVDVSMSAPETFLDRNTSSKDKIVDALQFLDCELYRTWIRVGMALKSWDARGDGGGAGFELWVEWSSSSKKFPGRAALQKRWRSFKKGDVSVGSIFRLAGECGWEYDRAQIERAKDSNVVGSQLGTWFCG